MSPQLVAVTVTSPATVGVTPSVPQVRAVTVGGFGPTGPQGPPGPSGVGGIEYVQSVPASSWTVPHGLGRRPGAVTVYDTSDNEVETGVIVLDLNTIEITMVAPMAGRVVVE